MKNYLIKMTLVVLVLSSIINIYKENRNNHYVIETVVTKNILFESGVNKSRYEEEIIEPVIVYEGLTLDELSAKLDKELNSTLSGYGNTIATLALERNVDPVVATSIILVETGCKWKCSYLVRHNYNVGGMRGSKGYMKFSSLEEGLRAFVGNLQKNYYEKGLTTPETMNKKYAENPNWHKDVNYYVKLIKAS